MSVELALALSVFICVSIWAIWDLVVWPILYGDYDEDTPT